MGLYRNLAYFSVKTILTLQQRLVRLSPECFVFLTQTQIHAAKVSSKQTFRCNDTHTKKWNLRIKSWAGNHHLGKCCWISSTNFFIAVRFTLSNFRGINTCRKQQIVKAMHLFLESFLDFFESVTSHHSNSILKLFQQPLGTCMESKMVSISILVGALFTLYLGESNLLAKDVIQCPARISHSTAVFCPLLMTYLHQVMQLQILGKKKDFRIRSYFNF